MTTTYVSDGDLATPANFNTWFNAASGNIYNVKAAAYGATGDGSTDDSTAIQAAIDAASSGGIVFFPQGTYLVNTVLTGATGVTFTGEGATSIIKSTTLAPGSQQGILDCNQKDDISVLNLKFQYTGTGAVNLVSFHGCNRIRVEGCQFEQTDNTNTSNIACIGVYDSGSAGSCVTTHITNNYFKPTNIAVLVQGSSSFNIDEVILANNIIDGANVNSTAQATGLLKVDLNINNCTVTGNVIDGGGAAYDGINIQEGVYRVVVSNNVIRDCQRNGIIFQDGQTGGDVQEGVISGNVIEEISGVGNARGIDLDISNGGSIRNITVSYNVIRNLVGEGIAENGTPITRLSIIGNVIDEFDSGATGKVGILARGTNVLVLGNYVSHATSGGSGNPKSFRIAAAGTALVVGNHFLAQDDTSAVTENGTATFIGNTNVGEQNFGGFLEIGTTPATAGDIRLPNASTIRFRNQANSANVQAITFNTNDQIVLGVDTVPSSAANSNLGTASLYFGNLFLDTALTIVNTTTPASAGAAGTKGAIAWDTNYIYVCVATNTWKRVGISTW